MAHMFGHSWVSQYGADPAGSPGDTWSAALAGLSPTQIAAGLTATLTLGSDWPPSAPRFRALAMGIPSMAKVRQEIRHPTGERSPFTRQVWAFLDGYLFARADQAKADRMLREAYELASEYVMRGGRLPEPMAGAIEAQKPVKPAPASDHVARQHLDAIAKKLHISEEEGE